MWPVRYRWVRQNSIKEMMYGTQEESNREEALSEMQAALWTKAAFGQASHGPTSELRSAVKQMAIVYRHVSGDDMTIDEALKQMDETTKRVQKVIEQQKADLVNEVAKRDSLLKDIDRQTRERIKEIERKYPVKPVGLLTDIGVSTW